MKYLDLLNLFLALGPKMPAIIAAVQKLVADFKELVSLVKPDAQPSSGDLQLVAVDEQEEAAEAQIAALMAADGSQALFDGSLLRGVFAFAKEHPELMAWILGLLKGVK